MAPSLGSQSSLCCQTVKNTWSWLSCMQVTRLTICFLTFCLAQEASFSLFYVPWAPTPIKTNGTKRFITTKIHGQTTFGGRCLYQWGVEVLTTNVNVDWLMSLKLLSSITFFYYAATLMWLLLGAEVSKMHEDSRLPRHWCHSLFIAIVKQRMEKQNVWYQVASRNCQKEYK